MKIDVLINRLNELKDKGINNVVIEDGNMNDYMIYDIVGEGKVGVIWIENSDSEGEE